MNFQLNKQRFIVQFVTKRRGSGFSLKTVTAAVRQIQEEVVLLPLK